MTIAVITLALIGGPLTATPRWPLRLITSCGNRPEHPAKQRPSGSLQRSLRGKESRVLPMRHARRSGEERMAAESNTRLGPLSELAAQHPL